MNQPLVDSFERHVTTRRAMLLCDQCDQGTRHRLHQYHHLDPVEGELGVLHVNVMFQCVDCGTVRQWGCMGRAWRDDVDAPEEDPVEEPTDQQPASA